jgi:hypothetical protein
MAEKEENFQEGFEDCFKDHGEDSVLYSNRWKKLYFMYMHVNISVCDYMCMHL